MKNQKVCRKGMWILGVPLLRMKQRWPSRSAPGHAHRQRKQGRRQKLGPALSSRECLCPLQSRVSTGQPLDVKASGGGDLGGDWDRMRSWGLALWSRKSWLPPCAPACKGAPGSQGPAIRKRATPAKSQSRLAPWSQTSSLR